jgi:hypothetical protein
VTGAQDERGCWGAARRAPVVIVRGIGTDVVLFPLTITRGEGGGGRAEGGGRRDGYPPAAGRGYTVPG